MPDIGTLLETGLEQITSGTDFYIQNAMALSENKAYLNYFAILGERKRQSGQIQS